MLRLIAALTATVIRLLVWTTAVLASGSLIYATGVQMNESASDSSTIRNIWYTEVAAVNLWLFKDAPDAASRMKSLDPACKTELSLQSYLALKGLGKKAPKLPHPNCKERAATLQQEK